LTLGYALAYPSVYSNVASGNAKLRQHAFDKSAIELTCNVSNVLNHSCLGEYHAAAVATNEALLELAVAPRAIKLTPLDQVVLELTALTALLEVEYALCARCVSDGRINYG
jgi:hypothetical protein